MVREAGLTVAMAAALISAFTLNAASHGKAITLGTMETVANVYGAGARLVSVKSGPEIAGTSWLWSVNQNGNKTGLVGVAREETPHGRLVQATCMDLDKNIIAIIPLRVMEDEKSEVDALTLVPNWWKDVTSVEPVGASLVLLKSVRKIKLAADAIK